MQILKDEIRQNILDSSLELFSTVGYDKTVMQSIALRCGISKGNLYRYFPSKEDIFLELINGPMSEIQKLTEFLTDKKELCGTSDEIAEKYIKSVFPVFKKYRREILMIIRSEIKKDGVLIRDMLMNGLLTNFFTFDKNKLPTDFIHTLSEMLIAGICDILSNYKNDDDMYSELLALLRYHVHGTLAFTNLR